MNGESAAKLGQCLSEETLSEYLEGTLDPVVRSACEVHLVACDPCRENLALFMRVMREDVTSEEETKTQKVLAEWERRNLQPVPAPQARSAGFRNWRYAIAAVAAVLVVAVGVNRWPSETDPTASDIVRLIVERERRIEARLWNQRYFPIERTRSEQPSPQYSLLLEAMTSQSASDYELGRFYLNHFEYDQAVQHLEKAAADPKAPPAVHNDLGAAYLERGGERDMERAEEQLNLALTQDSKFGPAVFNLVLLYVRKDMPAEAEKQARRYLELDSSSGWAQEVSQKLSEGSRIP